ncbi:MAG: GNAT family N-acetyltransferase [Acidobacteriota bacterium]
MSEYPERYESDILLRDGSTIHLRPIKPGDAHALMELHSRLSPRSVCFRFLSPLPELSEERASAFANVDYNDTFALVGELAGRLIGVARYYRDEKARDRAEVAFLIEDALQGRGIATRMLERLVEIAREKGITTFDTYVLGDNWLRNQKPQRALRNAANIQLSSLRFSASSAVSSIAIRFARLISLYQAFVVARDGLGRSVCMVSDFVRHYTDKSPCYFIPSAKCVQA